MGCRPWTEHSSSSSTSSSDIWWTSRDDWGGGRWSIVPVLCSISPSSFLWHCSCPLICIIFGLMGTETALHYWQQDQVLLGFRMHCKTRPSKATRPDRALVHSWMMEMIGMMGSTNLELLRSVTCRASSCTPSSRRSKPCVRRQ